MLNQVWSSRENYFISISLSSLSFAVLDLNVRGHDWSDLDLLVEIDRASVGKEMVEKFNQRSDELWKIVFYLLLLLDGER